MDAPTISTDSQPGDDDRGQAPVGGGLSAPTGPSGSANPEQTSSGSRTMNSHHSGSDAPAEGSAGTSDTGHKLASKGLGGAATPPTSNSVIQTPVANSQNAVQPTVALARPPMQPEGSAAKLNGENNASPGAPRQAGTPVQASVAGNSQPASSVSVTAGLRVIKAEPPQAIQTSPQLAVVPAAPRNVGTVAASQGGVRALTPQVLAPRLPQTSPGQPSVHNIQIPPGGLLYLFVFLMVFNDDIMLCKFDLLLLCSP